MSTHLQGVSALLGGLGLFLLGMNLMTDGLKLAAGPALERILTQATRTRWHGLLSGIVLTALVQSSSAVTVAAIGFIQAGLLGLGGALWVLFGANVGTTMTGWIVALVGLKIKVDALALPLIGAGVILRLVSQRPGRIALGTTLAGFGLLFLGINTMQGAFTGLKDTIVLPQGDDWLAVLAQLGVGMVLTVLMQSSSASMTVALTAAQEGLLSPLGAAAVVIGANVGTTITAVLAAVGASPNAKRAAAAHVFFNLLTGCVALIALPWAVGTVAWLMTHLGLPDDPATRLALFHTLFNVAGVLLMWPITNALTRHLQTLFRKDEGLEDRPQHLDATVLSVPSLAVEALDKEVSRVGQWVRELLHRSLDGVPIAQSKKQSNAIIRLNASIHAFAEKIHRENMSEASSAHLTRVLRAIRYHQGALEHLARVPDLDPAAQVSLPNAQDLDPAADFASKCKELLAQLGRPDDLFGQGLSDIMQPVDQSFLELEHDLLTAVASGKVNPAQAEAILHRWTVLRLAISKSAKALTQEPAALRET